MSKPLPFGPVMIDIAGTSLTPYDKEKIQHPNTGGLILFARNYQNPHQMTDLINQIRRSREGEILIAVDQEGGRVQRFQQGFTRLPAAAVYADHVHLAEDAGWLMATELISVGIDFSFAPVLDIDCGISEIIGNRSFSQDSNLATELASSFCKGMHRAGMAATGKHFPGHGAVALDSHLTLPRDDRPLADIMQKDIYPFKKLIEQGLDAIMPAHVVYSQVDSLPAGFSQRWIQQILRQQLAFDGVVFSDDLSMEGASFIGDYPQRANAALEAGCDMVLVCNSTSAAEQVLDTLRVTTTLTRQRRLESMKATQAISRTDLISSAEWQHISDKLTSICSSVGE